MGSIPLPALQVKTPQPEGVLDQYAKGLGVKNLIDENKLRGQQIQSNQNSLDEEAALKQAVAAAGGDIRKALPQIMQIAPEKGIALQKQFEEWDTADLTKKKAILDLHAKKAERIGQLAGTVTDPESRDLALKTAVEEGLMSQNDAAQEAQKPFDLNYYKNLQVQGMTAKDQHDATAKDLERQDRLAKEKQDEADKQATLNAPTTGEKNFQSFYKTWLEANELPKNAKNEMKARQEFNTMSKTPAPQQQLMVVPQPGGGEKVIEAKPGTVLPAGARTPTQVGAAEKPTADEQRRADLADNLNENLDKLEGILERRPGLFGPVAGRLTSVRGALGTSDPDVAALDTIKHQIGMAQISAHGMRSASGIESAANSIINGFKNSPEATKEAVKTARDSVKTFQKDITKPVQSRQVPGTTVAPPAGASNDPFGWRK
jgi:hypothetical protein